jgi:hypothetical protein
MVGDDGKAAKNPAASCGVPEDSGGNIIASNVILAGTLLLLERYSCWNVALAGTFRTYPTSAVGPDQSNRRTE